VHLDRGGDAAELAFLDPPGEVGGARLGDIESLDEAA